MNGLPILEDNGCHEALTNNVLQSVELSDKYRNMFMHVDINNTAAAAVSDECQPDVDSSLSVLAVSEDNADEATGSYHVGRGRHCDIGRLATRRCDYVREGSFERVVTICKKRPAWTRVFRRVIQCMGTDEVLEELRVGKHDARYWWRMPPRKNIMTRTTSYYCGSSGG